jgi:hypothetical protein
MSYISTSKLTVSALYDWASRGVECVVGAHFERLDYRATIFGTSNVRCLGFELYLVGSGHSRFIRPSEGSVTVGFCNPWMMTSTNLNFVHYEPTVTLNKMFVLSL